MSFLVYYLLAHSRGCFDLTNLLGTLETIFKGLKHRKDLSIRKSNGTDFSTSMVIHLCTSVFHVELFMNGSVRCSIFSCFSNASLNFLAMLVRVKHIFCNWNRWCKIAINDYKMSTFATAIIHSSLWKLRWPILRILKYIRLNLFVESFEEKEKLRMPIVL